MAPYYRRFYCRWMFLLLLALVAPAVAQVRISEFLAQNDGLTRDQDGDSPDWIELHNNSATPVNLGGWRLTDTETNLTKWTFPATNLPANSYLLVFASGKNRAVAGAELHTSFQLEDSGGYLAVVNPGRSIVHSYNYGSQRANVSFGISGASSTAVPLLTSGVTARYLVPVDGSLDNAWTAATFNDTTWNSGPTGLGFSSATGFALRVDFNERVVDPLTYTMPGFSAFVINSNVSTAAIQTNATTRTFGNVTLTLSNTAPVGYDDRLRVTPANNGAFTQSQLLRDVVFSRSLDNGGLDLTIENLLPGQPYSITIWSFDSGSPGWRVSDWFANGALVRENYRFNGTNAPISNDDYQFTFDALADASGRILVSGRRDSTSAGAGGAADLGVFLNALELTGSGSGGAATDVAAAMRDRNASIFIRVPFTVSDPAAVQQLRLRMKYDDGFVAYINSQQVAARNAPTVPAWNSTATAEHPNEQSAVFEEIVLDVPSGLLVAGQNVLAIHGLNLSAADSDFLIVPELDGVASAAETHRYFTPPTPRAPNGTGFLGLVADTRFSVDRGFYDTPFSVAITCATPGATIYWTTNGSAPSPTNGQIYSAPIAVARTTFLRAAAFLTNHVPSDVDTHTYIFLEQVLQQSNSQPGYPTTWQASYPADYGMDPNVVNHPVYGLTISNDLRSIPTLSIVSDHNGMWSSATGIYPNSTSTGPAWERAASVELIDGDGSTEFAINCKIEMHGNASRDNVRTPKHSMRLSFNSEVGPTKLRYDWFGGDVETHDGIVLRSCGFVDGWAGRYADTGTYTSSETGETFRGLRYRPENTCYLRDVWVKDSFRDMGWTVSRSAFVHLYINGLYWGLYQPSERFNASYFAEHHGGPEGAWDVLVGHDSGGTPVVVDGSVADWQTVLNLANAGVTTEAAYQAIAERIDIDNLIDYMMLHIFAESEDWPHHNWYVAHRRATNGLPATKFICSVWDQELTLDRLVRRDRTNVGSSGGEVYSPGRVYQQLRAWPEFRRQFGDRVHKHLFNDGALTPSNNVARLLAKAAVIRDAVVGESARWGDAREFPTPGNTVGTGKTFTRDEWWQPEIDKLATNFFQKLTRDNIARLRTASLYPNLNAPVLSQFGGAVSAGFQLGISHTNAAGTIFFTTDGSDPRTYGTGAVAPVAQAFSEPVPINAPTRVRARVFNGGQWSAIVDATFFPPQDLAGLALTEIMYNPPAFGAFAGDDLEFIELKNRGTNTLNLSGLVLGGIGFTFTNGTLLDPGEFFVLARNAAAFAAKYPGVAVNGVYTGRLDNGGEPLRVSFPFGGNVFAVTFDDDVPWPLAPDNFGYSIVPRNSVTTQAPDDGASWRASALPGGSPGADDPEPTIARIVINEILTASTPPEQDWIELFNPTTSPVDIGGWFLTDDANAPAKFRIPDGTTITAGGYATFTESQFNPTPGAATSFSLSSQGEQIYLFSGNASTNLTGYSHGFVFDAAASGVSFGRYVNSIGDEHFPAQITTTSNRANAGPRIGPVVINEVHYHPTNGGDEFIELRNISPAPISMYDPANPSNTWRIAGLDYTFPQGCGFASYCLIVATNPAAFRSKYNVPQNVPIVGPWSGALQDSGERLRLQRPGTPDTNGFGYITVDEVRYNDKAPWPATPDGTGASLQRIIAMAYANDPTNWTAALPTPGVSNNSGDSDFDGMPDEWEVSHGTNPSEDDADIDSDGDGRTNYEEYVAGTHPLNPDSQFGIVIRLSPSSTLSFQSVGGRVYTIESSPGLPGVWNTVGNELAGTGSTVTVPIAINDQARFFRVTVRRQ